MSDDLSEVLAAERQSPYQKMREAVYATTPTYSKRGALAAAILAAVARVLRELPTGQYNAVALADMLFTPPAPVEDEHEYQPGEKIRQVA